MRRLTAPTAILLVAIVCVLAACSGDASDEGAGGQPGSTVEDSAVEPVTTVTTEVADLPMDPRSQLTRRLATELDDEDGAIDIVAAMDDAAVASAEALADGDIAGSPWLSYSPPTAPAEEFDSLWVFSYGYRFAPGSSVESLPLGGAVPPNDALVPGPTNEDLAEIAADFVSEHPVPIVAQWEVAQVLDEMGVENVISVEPDVGADGSVVYLSTVGVAAKGLALMADQGLDPGHAGVLCFADHAARCVMTAEDAGLTADVPEGVTLPSTYDPESGQDWTRQRETWIPVDLAGRTLVKP